MTLPAIHYPDPPANVRHLVQAMGTRNAMAVLIRFGGSEVYVSATPGTRSELVQLVGIVAVTRLADLLPTLNYRVPLANRWLAKCLRAEGHSQQEIARRLRIHAGTVSRWLRQVEK